MLSRALVALGRVAQDSDQNLPMIHLQLLLRLLLGQIFDAHVSSYVFHTDRQSTLMDADTSGIGMTPIGLVTYALTVRTL